ncbi:hypothetical protein M758_UG245800 [Ceratodon purpureus]|nr:hypothetical protein M758_UG245800 [Ceratodon purpureus]
MIHTKRAPGKVLARKLGMSVPQCRKDQLERLKCKILKSQVLSPARNSRFQVARTLPCGKSERLSYQLPLATLTPPSGASHM